ncbi:MAG: type II/IV secretion system protein [Calditrichia bacterium]
MQVNTHHIFEDEWLAKSLLDYQILDEEFLQELRTRFADSPSFLDVLLNNHYLSAEDIGVFIENVLQIPVVDLQNAEIQEAAVEQLPERLCRKYQVFPLSLNKDQISVAFSNPFDLDSEKEIAYLTGKYVKTCFAFRHQIKGKIEEFYAPDKFIDNLMDRAKVQNKVKISGAEEEDDSSSVVRLVSMIIGEAIASDASDIHIEPKDKVVVVRYRVDGILRNIVEVPRSVQQTLISRIKIISNLNIAESRKPQDGKAKVIHDNTGIDLRISILPTSYGEKAVIRILDPRKARVSFQQMGINGDNLRRLESCFKKTQGMILVTGPTGSGKTTTLYAALNRIRNTANNILTIEDPIEYHIEGINQVQVNEKAGITFASALRSFLRQDPDVILVGEIRDGETAEIAMQASLTGHLVLSTLHTNNALGAITRLADMGVDVYKVASSLEAVVAQRLVRRLCQHCKQEKEPDDVEKKLKPYITQLGFKAHFYKADGCQKCGFSGYKGRSGVYEILQLTTELKDLIASGAPESAIRETARKQGFINLYEHALELIAEGVTDYKEMLRVINPNEINNPSEENENPSVPNFPKSVEPPLTKHMPGTGNTAPALGSASPESSRIPRVLLVEDSPDMRRMVRVLMQKKTNWELQEAPDGLQALELVERQKPDVIVLDIMMPEMDGYEFLNKLRENLATAAIPVIMLTALNGTDTEVKSFELGADDYISKPYKPDVLIARVKRLLYRVNHPLVTDEKKKSSMPNRELRLV